MIVFVPIMFRFQNATFLQPFSIPSLKLISFISVWARFLARGEPAMMLTQTHWEAGACFLMM